MVSFFTRKPLTNPELFARLRLADLLQLTENEILCKVPLSLAWPIEKNDSDRTLKLDKRILYLPFSRKNRKSIGPLILGFQPSSYLHRKLEQLGYKIFSVPNLSIDKEYNTFVNQITDYNQTQPKSEPMNRTENKLLDFVSTSIECLDKDSQGILGQHSILPQIAVDSVLAFENSNLSYQDKIRGTAKHRLVNWLEQYSNRDIRTLKSEADKLLSETKISKNGSILTDSLREHLATIERTRHLVQKMTEPCPVEHSKIQRFYETSSFDFVLLDGSMEPCLAIEFDGDVHDTDKKKQNDKKKNWLCITSGLPLLRISYKSSPLRYKTTPKIISRGRNIVFKELLEQILTWSAMGQWMCNLPNLPFETGEWDGRVRHWLWQEPWNEYHKSVENGIERITSKYHCMLHFESRHKDGYPGLSLVTHDKRLRYPLWIPRFEISWHCAWAFFESDISFDVLRSVLLKRFLHILQRNH